MKTSAKLKYAITINLDEALYNEVKIIADYYQRRSADLLRLLLKPIIINEYAKIQRATHSENRQPMTEARFTK